ncbi:GNAT family N-acetyltransferase [Pseudonocardia sp. GCM10023141]|uniref:GNAT family N-acetyltransferase n=1 Tax=Pseudonocardia sp. GCM10023141 TaxID=3252653 RepID=UPI00361389E6
MASAGAGCALPVPGIYGVPDRWPHVVAALQRAGYRPSGRVEAVLVADVAELPQPGPAPLPGLTLATALGPHATQLSAVLDGRVVAIYEVQGDLSVGGTRSRLAGRADVWNLGVEPGHRRRGIATWLVAHGVARLRLGGARRLLDYAVIAAPGDDNALLPFVRRLDVAAAMMAPATTTHEEQPCPATSSCSGGSMSAGPSAWPWPICARC